jgi:osmotically inducible lipoprotein OsmB
MSTRLVTLGATTLLLLSLSACSGLNSSQTSTGVGAVVGGVAGSILTGGSTVGTVGGAAVGGVIGNKVDADKHKH